MGIEQDPHWHWNGQQWLTWNGATWVVADPQPAVPGPAAEPPHVPTTPAAAPDDNADGVRDDIEAAKSRMITKFGGKRELKKLSEHVWPDEKVARMCTGSYGGGIGLLVMTDKRLIFLKEGMMSSTLEDFPFSKISSIQWSTGMLTGKMTIFLSGNKGEITNVAKADGKAIADEVRARISGIGQPSDSTPDPSPQAVAAPAKTPFEMMEQLEQMRAAGYVSDDEYAAKRAEILSRM